MSSDTFTEITTQSWGSRLKDSIGGIFFGIIMVIASFILLFWNEGRAVKRAQALEEGAASVISVSSLEIDPANEGKLVHVTGETQTSEILSDSNFKVSQKAIQLTRSSEMYQWEEKKESKTKEKVGGKKETTTTYTYRKVWSAAAIDSSNFKKPDGHDNPGGILYPQESRQAEEVKLDAFRLTSSQISSISGFQPLALPHDVLDTIPLENHSKFQIEGNTLYYGKDPSNPEIGDLKIQFRYIPPGQTISVIAQQKGNSFLPYVAKSGSQIDLLSSGSLTAEAMFQSEMRSNTILTWVIRIGGFFLMFIGFRVMFNIFRTLAAVVPFIAKIVGFGLSLLSGLLAASFTLLTIAIAWLFYRPLLSIILIVVVVIILVAVRMLKKNKQEASFVPPPPTV
ncbi:MAG: hypothetical protein CR997_08850 [Acidobacteria bacterium]|nr:MAG: hypothetical protein CR997_08850 [Acidobacteriota bacterium]